MNKRRIARTAVRRTVRPPMRRRRRRRPGFSFFLVTLLILAIALLYIFAGELLFPSRDDNAVMPVEGEIIVTFIDVGQGDSILVRDGNHAVLIDAGEHRARQAVIDYLNEAGITFIDYVVATHPHSDHIGGLVTVLRDFDVGYVLMPDATNDTETFLNFLDAIENNDISTRFPSPGDRVQAGIIDMVVKGPEPGHHANLNNASIVLRMQHGQTSFLFTGDAEVAAENWLVETWGTSLQSNVLKVGHHGSRTSTTESFLRTVNPAAAVIQSGEGNRHGHPHQEVVDRLEAHGVTIYRNDQLGTIRMITNGQSIFTP
ncbi:MAG: MBL fold metallo-hydrolase [Defluviitaleaceae bacterium]|nr:MBL fold metallo-hydrolase [Defluviitaleaceae bacterium]